MAQKQYTTYQADILSFELRDALLGILKPGRYTGFNLMTEYQAVSGNNIYCRLTHTTGINKYDKASPPVLEAQRGIAVSTQGTVIAEDGNVDFTIVSSTVFGDIYHLIYMEHEYTEVAGANPATYGVITGTEGGGRPALTSPTNRVVLGYVLQTYFGGSIDFDMLEWIPAQSEINYGDHSLAPKLWGTEAAYQLTSGELGTIPTAGAIGSRQFSSNNYVTDFDSLTKAVGDLDNALDIEETARIALGNRPLDSASWGALSDITTQNANTTRHGLLPKLSNDADEFLNGLGNWEIPLSGFIFRNVPISGFDEGDSLHSGGTITMGVTYEWDVSGIVPSGYTQVFLMVQMRNMFGAANASNRYGRVMISKGGTGNSGFFIDGAPPFQSAAISGVTETFGFFISGTGLVELSPTRTIRIGWGNYSGSITDWMYSIQFRVVAYR